MKIKNVIFLVLEGAAVLGCVGGIYFLSTTKVEPTEVYRYTKHLTANTIIQAGDYEKIEIPASAITSDFILEEDDILGKGVKSDVYPGEYSLGVHLSEASELDPFKGMDLSDKVKVAVPVKLEQAVGGLLNAGDIVDLHFTGEYKSNEGDGFYSTRFIESVPVYQVLSDTANVVTNNIETGKVEYTEEGSAIENSGDVAQVVLAVTPEQALEIQTRLAVGQIWLVGHFGDTETSPTQDFLMTNKIEEIHSVLTKVEVKK